MPKVSLATITSGYAAVAALNANFAALSDAIDNTLSRDGTSPNSMESTLDMDSHRLINLADAENAADAVTLSQLQAAQGLAASFPSQTGHSGKFLTTDGDVVSWATVAVNVSSVTGTLPVANGGTGATNTTAARLALNAAQLGGVGTSGLTGSEGAVVGRALGAGSGALSELSIGSGLTTDSGTLNTKAGWELIASKTANASATIDFTINDHVFVGADYQTYMIELCNVKPASDDVRLGLRIGTGAGPTYQTTTYQYGGTRGGSGATVNHGSTTDGVTNMIALSAGGGGAGVGNAAGENLSGSVEFSNPDGTDFCVFRGKTGYMTSSATPHTVDVSGVHSAVAITALRFLFSSGNIASGTFRLYGLRTT